MEEDNKGSNDLCRAIIRSMDRGLVIDNWKELCTLLLSKTTFDDKEAQILTLGIHLAKTPTEMYK